MTITRPVTVLVIPTAFLEACEGAGVEEAHRPILWNLYQRWPLYGSPDSRLKAVLDDYLHWLAYDRSLTGDDVAARTFDRYWRRNALRESSRKGLRRPHAEEILGAFYERVYSRLSTRDWQHPFRPYLRAILRNLVVDEVRRMRRAESRLVAIDGMIEAALTDPHSPEAAVEQLDLQRRVQRTLACLPASDQSLLAASVVPGYSGENLAWTLGISRNAVYKRLCQARQRFAAVWRAPADRRDRCVYR